MLERQQVQLVSCIQQLYRRLRTAGLWEPSLPENSNGQPLTHDILAALDLLQHKADGRSTKFESFVDVVPSSASDNSQSDNDSPPPIFDGDTEGPARRDSIMNETRSPSLHFEDAASHQPTNADLESHSNASPPPDPILHSSPVHPKQVMDQKKPPDPTATQTRAEYHSSQARLFSTLATEPIRRSVYDTPNLHSRRSPTKPSLSVDPQLTYQDNWPNQAMSAPLMQVPSCHEWAQSGITLDDSDFSTDFHQFSPLDGTNTCVFNSSLVPGAL